MAQTSKQLGQETPTTTTAITLYQGSSASNTIISTLYVANTDTGANATAACRVFHNDAGTNYDTTNAIYYDKLVNGKQTVALSIGPLNGAGAIGVRSSSANALTFTLYGTEETP
jgi:hypothetical protein